MISFDAHVHIHETFSLDRLLDCARGNFARLAPSEGDGSRDRQMALLLSEMKETDYFTRLREKAGGAGHTTAGGWHVACTGEAESLRLTRDDWSGRLFLLAGRQVVSAERIEVLTLATAAKVPDGLSLARTVEAVRGHGGLAVLPWGVGKWLGKRGKMIDDFVQRAAAKGLFVGDNGGRPLFWPAPRLFMTAATRGIRLLPGSDSLPLPAEESRVGGYGGSISGEIRETHPAEDLRRLLIDASSPIVPFGRRMSGWRFLRTQVALRRLK